MAAPRYFAGAYSFGVLMQINSAFGTVSDSFSWFINSYSTLVEWRATVNRLHEFKRVMRSKLVLGIADGWLSADGNVIYRALDLKVGLFQNAAPQASGA